MVNRLSPLSRAAALEYTAAAIIVVSLGLLVARLARAALAGVTVVPDWQAGQFWIDYSGGFVRRGLPGEILTIVTSGPPSATDVAIAGALLVLVALVAWALLTYEVARSAPIGGAKLAAAIIVVAPFSFCLTVSDFARYDSVGVIAAAVIVLTKHVRQPTLAASICGISVLAATASEEFLLLFVAPLVWLALRRAGVRRVTISTGLTLLPSVLVAGASVLTQPPISGLWLAASQAHSERPRILPDGSNSAIGVIPQSATGALERLIEMPWWILPAAVVLFGGSLAAAVWLLWRSAGSPERMAFWAVVSWGSTAAFALSLIAIDYRRWWALAFLLAVSAVPLLKRGNRPSIDIGAVAVAALAVLVATQFTPLGAERLAPAFANNTRLPPESSINLHGS